MIEKSKEPALAGKSAEELRNIAKRALRLAEDTEKSQPSYRLALENGIEDRSYDTVANGRISSFSGEAIICLKNGTKWKAVGHRPTGDAYYVAREGYIEFIPIEI